MPYAEKLLSPEGDAIVWDFWDGPPDDSVWVGTVRLVFFLHYLNLGRSVRTPWGELALPVAESLPERLASIRYESP